MVDCFIYNEYKVRYRFLKSREISIVCVCVYLTSGGQRHVAPALGSPSDYRTPGGVGPWAE